MKTPLIPMPNEQDSQERSYDRDFHLKFQNAECNDSARSSFAFPSMYPFISRRTSSVPVPLKRLLSDDSADPLATYQTVAVM
jgi:hypothetical protein